MISLYPHIIRIAFGNCFSTPMMRREITSSIKKDNTDIWSNFGGNENVTWFVAGIDNANTLKGLGAKNIRLIYKQPLIHNEGVSFWHNKTSLILQAFKEFGMQSEVMYLDCDIDIVKAPDKELHTLLQQKALSGSRTISPIRWCKRAKRLMLPDQPSENHAPADRRICPCNCLMYGSDGSVFEEFLELYPEFASIYENKTKQTHWTGTPTTQWDDESISMYWFDKSHPSQRDTQSVVQYFEPPSTIVLERHPPKESSDIKNPMLVYFQHH